MVNSIKTNPDFEWAENQTRLLLKEAGYQHIQGPDWIAKSPTGEWEAQEVKYKEFFEPGVNFPYWGAGLNIGQVMAREQMRHDLGVRTKLFVYGKGVNVGECYTAFLDELESKGGFYDTRNRIRIYPIDNFDIIPDAPNQKLGGA